MWQWFSGVELISVKCNAYTMYIQEFQLGSSCFNTFLCNPISFFFFFRFYYELIKAPQEV